MLILFQIGKSLDNMIQFIVFSAIDLALEYIDVINSIRNSSPPSSLKYLRPIGTRVETGGVRILFGGKSKTIRSSSAQIHTSVDNTLAHTVLGWALWCWEALYGNVVVAWLKYCSFVSFFASMAEIAVYFQHALQSHILSISDRICCRDGFLSVNISAHFE